MIWAAVTALPAAAQFTNLGNFNANQAVACTAILPGQNGAPDEVAVVSSANVVTLFSFAAGVPTPVASLNNMGGSFAMGGDVDGDGISDLVLLAGANFIVLKRTASGLSVLQWVSTPFLPDNFPRAQLVDFDADGDLDIFHQHSYFPNNGSGTFGSQIVVFPFLLSIFETRVDDIDLDGDADVLVFDNGVMTVYLRNGASLGALSSTMSVPAPPGTSLRIFDFDGDGNKDLFYVLFQLVGTTPTYTTYFAKGLGGGTFQLPVSTPFPSGYSPNFFYRFVHADLEGDSYPDVFLSALPGGITLPPTNYVFSISPNGTLIPRLNGAQVLSGQRPLEAARFTSSPGQEIVALNGNPNWATTVAFFESTITPLNHQLTVVSGGGQTMANGSSAPLPVVIEVREIATSAPVSGVGVTFSSTGGLTVTPAGPLVSDALGRISFNVIAGASIGSATVTVQAATAANLSIPFTIQPAATLTAISGTGQWAFVSGPPLEPIVFSATLPNGMPWVGGQVTLASTGGVQLPPGTSPAVTDAQGRVAVSPTITNVGAQFVIATIGSGPSASQVIVPIAVRRLLITHTAGSSFLSINYVHEDGPTPIIIAADIPRTPIVTNYGSVATSILAPQPGLALVDGLGLFGPANPAAVANLSYSNVTSNLPPALIGVTLVFQAYGFDPSYPSPRDFFVSPAITRTL